MREVGRSIMGWVQVGGEGRGGGGSDGSWELDKFEEFKLVGGDKVFALVGGGEVRDGFEF